MEKGINIKDIEEVKEPKIPAEKLLTGEYIKGLNSDSNIEPDSELEGNEYVLFPDGTLQKVLGNSHEKGGAKMAIPDGTKIMSDSLKPTAPMRKKLEKSYGIKVKATDTFAKVIDRYTQKIGLNKITKEQEEVFELLKKELKKDIDKNTSLQNQQYISQKVKALEDKRTPLEENRKGFFEDVFLMQETLPKPKQEEEESEDSEEETKYEYGGMSNSSLEALAQKYGVSVDSIKNIYTKNSVPKFPDGGIFVNEKDKRPYVGSELTATQQENLIKYYEKHQPSVAAALKSKKLDWGKVVVNRGLVEDIDKFGFDKINVGNQKKDATTFLKQSPTYGGMTQNRVDNFVLRDYYEANNPGKKFEDITPKEIQALQDQYSQDIGKANLGTEYFSGVKANQKSDSYFGNRTSSYLRNQASVVGKKAGKIDVDKLYGKTPEAINKELEDYGLTYEDIKPYQNSAYKFIDISTKDAPESQDPEVKDQGTALEDLTKKPKVPTGPQGFYTPDQSVLPPSAQEAHLKGDIRLERIDPVRIGIQNVLENANTQRTFIAKAVDNLPTSQRAAVLANLLASTQKNTNQSIVSTNMTNAQNESQAELFNINQSGQEEAYGLNNALSFEERQLKAKANTEEELRRYYDENRAIGLNNYQNQKKLNLMNSLFPDYNLDYFGASVEVDPNSDPQILNNQAKLWLNAFSNSGEEASS